MADTEESQVKPGPLGFPVRLVCWSCGAFRELWVERPPQFSFELAGWAKEAGMTAFADFAHQRTLVFCNADCAHQQMTKGQRFRLRPKRAQAVPAAGLAP